LTYNITLVNYIKDRIKDIRETFFPSLIEITNYHQWFKGAANKYGLKIERLSDWDNEHFFKPVAGKIEKYETLLIDEVQDYKECWLRSLTSYFLKPESEFVVFGDEKQNIYENPLDENKEPIIPKMSWPWNKKLKKIYRFRGTLTKIAVEFQKKFFSNKYGLEEIGDLFQPELEFVDRKLLYYDIEEDASFEDIVDVINFLLQDNDIHPGDTTVMCSFIQNLRQLEFSFRKKQGEKTERTFESLEEYDEHLKENNGEENKSFLEDLRRRQKLYFYAKSGKIKFSTVHSFKGWESDTIILIIDKNKSGQFSNDELVYTGLTRAKSNLFILNTGSKKHHDFFHEFRNE
jgi:hypothetical protein